MKKLLGCYLPCFFAFFMASAAGAVESAPGPVSAGSVSGEVLYRPPGGQEFAKVTAGMALPQGSLIKTGPGAKLTIVFGSGSLALIDSDSEIELAKFEMAPVVGPVAPALEPAVSETELKLVNGGVTSKVNKLRKGSSYTIHSPVGAAGVRGTIFSYTYASASRSSSIQVGEGLVVFAPVTGAPPQNVPAGKSLNVVPVQDAAGGVVSVSYSLEELAPAELQRIVTPFAPPAPETGGVNAPAVPVVPVPDTTVIPVSPD